MEAINIFILSTSLMVGYTPNQSSADEGLALKALAKASYRQAKVDVQVKSLEKRYVDDEFKKLSGYALLISKVINEKKVSYEWRF